MNAREIDKKIGYRKTRERKTRELAEKLADFLASQNFEITGPFPIGRLQSRELKKWNPKRIHVEYRAKLSGAIAGKMERCGESLEEMLDVYGLRAIVPSVKILDEAAEIIWKEFEKKPTRKEMILRGGKLFFSPMRDYRRRDWEGASPLSGKGYDTAIHINKKTPFGMAEIQVMTAELYRRHVGSGEASHRKFKARQREFYRTKK